MNDYFVIMCKYMFWVYVLHICLPIWLVWNVNIDVEIYIIPNNFRECAYNLKLLKPVEILGALFVTQA